MAKQAKETQWTSDEVEYLLAKRKLGLTAQQIAGELGRTRGAIYAKLKELREKGKQIAAELAAEEEEQEESAPREDPVPLPTAPVKLPVEEDPPENRSYREDMQALSNAFAKVEESFGGCDRAVVYLTRAGATLQVAYGEMTVRVEKYHTA